MDLFIESDVARITVHLPHTPEEQQYLVEGKELESDLERQSKSVSRGFTVCKVTFLLFTKKQIDSICASEVMMILEKKYYDLVLRPTVLRGLDVFQASITETY